jgi:uncharacterized membrane protein
MPANSESVIISVTRTNGYKFMPLLYNLQASFTKTIKSLKMKKNIIIFSIIVLSSCSAKVLKPSETDASRGAAKFPGLTSADLALGHDLYMQKCTLCHPAVAPSSETEERWRKLVPGMAEKSKQNGKGEISAHDQDLILKYVVTMSTKSH